MRILFVHPPGAFRSQCETHISAQWPGATIDSHDPQVAGKPDAVTQLDRYDTVLLDLPTDPPNAADPLSWLTEWTSGGRERNAVPPLILLSAGHDQETAVRAMKLGAADFLRKDKVTSNRLISAIHDAIIERAQARDTEMSNTARMRTLTSRSFERASYSDDDATLQLDFPATQQGNGGVGADGLPTFRVRGYRVKKMIGQGGSARVFLAVRESDQREVVLKVLHPEVTRHDSFLQRFLREYRVIADMQNEHVARIYDQGISDDVVYIAMEYFPLGDLKNRMENRAQRPISSLDALRLTAQIARALDAVHTNGVIHRDLKPHNIMLRSNDRLALVDFGLAKHVGDITITATGGLLATPLYMSPEQCLGRELNERSDLYSVGVILYELLTGLRLYDSANLATIAFQHVHAEIPQLQGKLAGYQTVMEKLLAKNPDDRFQSARELFAHIAH